MLEAVSNAATTRLRDVQLLLAHIQSLEDTGVAMNDVVSLEMAVTLRGLFFVHLYGSFEYIVTQSVQAALQGINRLSIPHDEFTPVINSVTLDSLFNALVGVGPEKTWSKRLELLKKQCSSESCVVNDTVFHRYLQNVWYKTLRDIFDCLGLSVKPVPEMRLAGYIDDIVQKRNAVAHGRSSPDEVGRAVTSGDLHRYLSAMTATINHIVATIESHLTTAEFVEVRYRVKYISASGQS